MHDLGAFENSRTAKHENSCAITCQIQFTRVHIHSFGSSNLASTKPDEIAWYDPIGDHQGHYDIDGVSQYRDIDQRREKL